MLRHTVPYALLLLALGWLVAVPDAQAQVRDCEAALATAAEEYANANYDLALTWADYCLRRLNPTEAEQQQAYHLQALAYLGKDQIEDARNAISSLLLVAPDYVPDPESDPEAYVTLVRDLRGDVIPTDTTRSDDSKDYVEIEVFYGTDRKVDDTSDPSTYFGGERGTLVYGTCHVSIPKGHQIGKLESPPSWLGLTFKANPAKHIVLLEVSPLDEDDFHRRMQARGSASGEKELLVFIHGYNVTFEDAARRTAQITYDLGFDGVPVFYSWPSNGNILEYLADEADVRWTVPHLQRFLEDLAARSGAEHINVIAHSMGNRAFTNALLRIAPKYDEPVFDQVVFTAPDVDADVFLRDIIPAVRSTANRLTLYASSKDRALQASKNIHQYPRAGESGDHLVVTEGLDTIDVSDIDTDLLGHSYFASTKSLLEDIYQLVLHGHSPLQRKLREHRLRIFRYWTLQ
ncbi:MAG TPA: alpha/beta hydrolase [Rhodothermales bacterium]|nr:alpha/beta hydrolase [Rhodothermales bacterium]